MNNDYYISENNTSSDRTTIDIDADDIHESAQAVMDTICKYIQYEKSKKEDDD